jgi:trigger factor
MPTTIENVSTLERRMTMAVPLADIDKQVGERLKRLAGTVRMPGFRPGKVPMKIVAQQYEGQVRGEVIGDVVQKAFTDAVSEQSLRVAGYPKIEPKSGGATDQLEFSATFEVYPEIKLGDISSARVERRTLTVGDAEVDRTIESLRKQRATFVAASRPAQTGDRVTIDFVGKIDGVEFQGGSGKAMPFVLGEKRMLPEFEAGVIGKSVGDTASFPLKFPDDYQGKDVAGKTAQFEVTVVAVEEPKLPAIDAELAKSLGVADGDIQKMRAEIRENVEREVRQRLAADNKQRVMQALLETTQVEVPRSLVEMEQDRMVQAARADLAARGLKDAQNVPIDRGIFKDQATRRVTLGLIIGEVIKQHQLSAKPEQVRKLVEEQARTYEQPFEVVKWVYSQPERLAEFEGLAVEENVVNWVLSKARVEDRAVGFDELMGNAA